MLNNGKLVSSFATAAVAAILIVCMLIYWWDSIALLSAVVGLSFGWMGGILLAPYESEVTRFQKLSKGLMGFFSGYIFGKIDRVFDLTIEKGQSGPLILNPYFMRNIGVAIACATLACTAVFVARTYWQAVTPRDVEPI
jgi:hypothetical protein